MSEKYTLKDLTTNEDDLYEFLYRVWLCGVATGLVNINLSFSEIKDKFAPDFKNELKGGDCN